METHINILQKEVTFSWKGLKFSLIFGSATNYGSTEVLIQCDLQLWKLSQQFKISLFLSGKVSLS